MIIVNEVKVRFTLTDEHEHLGIVPFPYMKPALNKTDTLSRIIYVFIRRICCNFKIACLKENQQILIKGLGFDPEGFGNATSSVSDSMRTCYNGTLM